MYPSGVHTTPICQRADVLDHMRWVWYGGSASGGWGASLPVSPSDDWTYAGVDDSDATYTAD